MSSIIFFFHSLTLFCHFSLQYLGGISIFGYRVFRIYAVSIFCSFSYYSLQIFSFWGGGGVFGWEPPNMIILVENSLRDVLWFFSYYGNYHDIFICVLTNKVNYCRFLLVLWSFGHMHFSWRLVVHITLRVVAPIYQIPTFLLMLVKSMQIQWGIVGLMSPMLWELLPGSGSLTLSNGVYRPSGYGLQSLWLLCR